MLRYVCYARSHSNSTPLVLLDDATVMRHPICSIKATLKVTLEGASAMNYNQVSPEANIVLRVSYGPGMIGFGLAMKYLLHGTLLCCSLSTGFRYYTLPSCSPHIPAPYFLFPCRFTLYISKKSPHFPH